jgi:hypothetical protein
MLTSDNKIVVYDLFEERLVKIIELKGNNANSEIINLTYEYTTVLEPIRLIHINIEKGTEIAWTSYPTK